MMLRRCYYRPSPLPTLFQDQCYGAPNFIMARDERREEVEMRENCDYYDEWTTDVIARAIARIFINKTQ